MNDQQSQRVALVTGASRGLGRAVALALAAEGAHVIAVARTQGALEDLDDAVASTGAGSATLVPLDLTDFAGIDRIAAAVLERWGRLDVLVGNAGVLGELSPVPHLTPDTWQRLFDVNVTANWRLLRAFDPLLRQSEAGRAIFVTSGAAKKHTPFWGGYGISKAALDHMVMTYANEIAKTPVRANLLSPGPTATAMRAKAMPGEDPATLPSPEDVARLFVVMSRPSFTDNGVIVSYREWASEQD